MKEFNLKEFNKSIRADTARKALETEPYLIIIQVGNNPASDIYVRNKIKACEECNIKVELNKLPEDISEEDLLTVIEWTSINSKVTGIIVQMPLPDHIDPLKIYKAIDPNKDVDGFNPINVGRHALGEKRVFKPCTVSGISNLLKELNPPEWYKGKNCVIIGRSNIVGKPMAYEMINNFSCTTTICNSHTPEKELLGLCRNADIIICAVGKPEFLTGYHLYSNSRKPIVIDVGINRLENGKIVGDCREDIKEYCAYITPVPGGVGPLTITGLLHNVAYYKDYQV